MTDRTTSTHALASRRDRALAAGLVGARRFVYGASIAGVVALGACSSPGPSRTATDTHDVASGLQVGEEGGFCGGIGALPCNAGLSCKLSSDKPDAGGTCEKSSKPSEPAAGEEGGFCGGIGALPCNAGLECVLVGDHPDAGGTCEKSKTPKTGEEGGFCGGIAAFQCNAGLECKLDGDYPDAGGKCVKSSKPSGK